MARMKKTELLEIFLNRMEDPDNYQTWENIRLHHLHSAGRIVVYYPSEKLDGYYEAYVLKDQDRNFDL